jgi:hypothetical protein
LFDGSLTCSQHQHDISLTNRVSRVGALLSSGRESLVGDSRSRLVAVVERLGGARVVVRSPPLSKPALSEVCSTDCFHLAWKPLRWNPLGRRPCLVTSTVTPGWPCFPSGLEASSLDASSTPPTPVTSTRLSGLAAWVSRVGSNLGVVTHILVLLVALAAAAIICCAVRNADVTGVV